MKCIFKSIFAPASLAFCIELAAFLGSHQCQAAGLASPFGEVIIKDCPLGIDINLRDLVNRPYRVTNIGLAPENVEVIVYRPTDPAELREGYELLPSSVSVRLEKTEFYLAPGQEGLSDIWIHFPKDERYFGKKYEVQIWARTKAFERFIGIGVISRVLIHTASTLMTPEELKRSKEIVSALEFYIAPSEISISDFPLGVEVPVKKRFKKSFRIVNFHDQPMRLNFNILEVSRSYAMLPEGYQIGQGDWLKLQKPGIEIPPNSIGEIPFSIHIPDRKEHRGQKYYIIIEAQLQGYEVQVSAYGRIAVQTQGGKE